MLTIDASVWVNGFDGREAGHEVSRAFLDGVRARGEQVVLPNLALIEVAGAISRTRGSAAKAQAFADAMAALAGVRVVALDETLARAAVDLAARHGMRGADSVYGAVAVRYGCELVTLDAEHLARLGRVLPVRTPADVVAGWSVAERP
jgi:predicted nucleic acid-binding protein